MLSFSKGKPFAVLVPKYEGEEKKLYIHDGMDDIDKRLLKGLTREEKKELKEAVLEGEPEFLSPKLLKIWKEVGGGDIGTSFHSDEYVVNVIPTDDPDQRDSIYVTGPSGSGKSCWISKFIGEYRERYPDRDIIVFSGKEEDPALDEWNVQRVPLDEELVDNPVGLEELENTLVVFDDIDQIGTKAVQDAVWKLRDKILELGRSKGISICTVAHQITNYKASRVCLNEADYVVFFPKSGSSYQLKYFLKNYAGMDKKQIARVMGLKSRAVVLKKTYPMCVAYHNGAYVV